MKEELIQFIQENNLSPFNEKRVFLEGNITFYRTRNAKQVHRRVISKLSEGFVFPDTSNLFDFFKFSTSSEEIKKRQDFFKRIKDFGVINNSFLKELKKPLKTWTPEYSIIVVTENYEVFEKLRQNNCPVQMIVSESDIYPLKDYDIVQIFDCPEHQFALENLPNSVLINSIDDAYLERYLEELSAWKQNLFELADKNIGKEGKALVKELNSLLSLLEYNDSILTKDFIEKKVEEINEKVSMKLRELTIKGESLVHMIEKGELPEELKKITMNAINESSLPINVLNIGIPVTIDEIELDKLIQQESSSSFIRKQEEIKNQAEIIKKIPEKLSRLSSLLLVFDFISGISRYLVDKENFPEIKDFFEINNSKNILLEDPQPISFRLIDHRCSVLTGANSGGKTTLLEHIIQLYSLLQLGLPVYGEFNSPLFEDIYYFAKNKGSATRGAFENLLSQLSSIKPGNKTLILADEIEAVTEPGAAGKIISATIEYYVKKNCFLIIATHLGQEINEMLPEKTRIDGIEAKGLDDNFELIVDHNPIENHLASSTPELIIEKMARKKYNDYLNFVNSFIKSRNI